MERIKLLVKDFELVCEPDYWQAMKQELDDMEVALGQAAEFALYVRDHAKGKMSEAAEHFLSNEFAEEIRKKLYKGVDT